MNEGLTAKRQKKAGNMKVYLKEYTCNMEFKRRLCVEAETRETAIAGLEHYYAGNIYKDWDGNNALGLRVHEITITTKQKNRKRMTAL